MRPLLALLAALLLAAFVVVSPSAARADEPPRLEHPELPAAKGEVLRPTPALRVGARIVWAYGADLLVWDDAAKAVVQRIRLPARIAAVAPKDDRSVVATLTPRSEIGFVRDAIDVVVALDGSRPGRGFWTGGYGEAMLAMREARLVARGFDAELGRTLDAQTRTAAIAALEAREALDRTNPFLSAIRGQLLVREGRADDARRAFEAAADTRGAAFNDLLRVSTILEDEGASDLAQRAFDRGLAAMRAAGVRPDRVQSQVGVQVLQSVPRRALAAAIAAGDVARVDRILERLATAFPSAEGADLVFTGLADWFSSRGRVELASKWRSHAARASTSVTNARTAASIDRFVPLVGGMTIVAPLVAFVVGLRRGARRSDPTRRIVVDLAAAVAPLLVALGLLIVTAARIEALGRQAAAPVALLDDAAASPDVERWVEARLAPSAEREALLAYARAELAATKAGGRNEGPAPSDATTRAALVRPDWRAAAAIALRSGGLRGEDGILGYRHTVLAAGLLFLLGFWIGGRTPRAAVAAGRVVPGGPASLGVLGPVLGGLFVGALLALAGLDRALSSIALPNVERYYGVESIVRVAPPPHDRAWAYTTLVAYALVHVAGVLIDRSRARREGR